MSVYTFTVAGVPVAKGRARSFAKVVGGKAISGHYTPSKTREAEQTFVARCLPFKPETPIAGPIALELVFVLPVPKSDRKLAAQVATEQIASERNGVWRDVPHTKRPDLDNLEKLVKDAMNGVFWLDDKQVCRVTKRKIYGTIPRTEVRIEEL